MAATYTDNGGSVNGSNKVFTYSFPVLQTEDIQVALNGVTQATNRYTPSLTPANITFHNSNGVDSTVQEADGAPKSGVTVRVYRETTVGKANGDEDPKAVFAAGSSIRAGDLNANIEQALFGIHEQQEKIIQTEDLADDAVTSAKLDTNIDIAGTLDVTGATTLDNTLNVAGTSTHATVDINGGAIDGTTIGANSAAAGTFTNGTIATADINGGAIDGTTIGASSAAAGTFTTVTASGTITGNVTGNITGDVTGDVTGDLTGNADTATALETGRTIASTGDVVWNSGSFDGTANKTAAATIQNDAVTYAKMQNVSSTNKVLGRDSGGAGIVEEISPSALRTMINVEDGADVTDATNVDAAGAVMNSDLATKGTIIVGDGSGDPTILPVGTNNHVLVADSSEASGIKWSTVSSASGFNNVVEDTTPQLGGALDVQAQEINTSTTNGNIKLTPNGTGVVEVKGNTNPGTLQLNCENNSHSVKIKGPAHSAAASYTLTLPDDDGTVDQVLKTDGSGNLSWGANVVIWTLGINGGADAFTFTGPGFASATDNPDLYLSRGQTYKFINGNASGTHAFNIEKSDHDETWSAYTTGMTGAGATGGNTMTWTVPMDAPSLLRYKSGTTAAMSNRIHITDSSVTVEGFETVTGARISGLQVNNGLNGAHMAFFGTHPTGYQPLIKGVTSSTTTFQESGDYSFHNGAITLKSYGTNTTTPSTIKFEGGGSGNTYGPTISGPATAQATSNYTITLPGVVPTANGQVLSATTAGVCSWADATPLTTEGDILYRDGSGTQRLAKGTAGQALIMNSGATAPEWGAAGATIANDANNRVITADGSAGLNGEANLTFDGSTLALTGNQTATLAVQAQGYEAPATVTANWSIAAANNAFFPGPMTVDSGVTVTVPANRTLTIV